MSWSWILTPLISAIIGWFTNWLAIKMLFHPQQPYYILGYNIQGVFPKRQHLIAEQLGTLISEKLFNTEELMQQLHLPDNIYHIKPDFDTYLDSFLRSKIKENLPLLGIFISEKNILKMRDSIVTELNVLIPTAIQDFTHKIHTEIDVKTIVSSKVKKFSILQLEEMLQDIISHELRFVEIVGAVVGFLIGLLNVAIQYFLN